MSTLKGKVKWFNGTKGYGFIEREDKEKDVFVHSSAVRDAGLKFLKIGREGGFAKSTNLGHSSLGYKESFISKLKRSFAKNQFAYYSLLAFLLVLITFLTVV